MPIFFSRPSSFSYRAAIAKRSGKKLQSVSLDMESLAAELFRFLRVHKFFPVLLADHHPGAAQALAKLESKKGRAVEKSSTEQTKWRLSVGSEPLKET